MRSRSRLVWGLFISGVIVTQVSFAQQVTEIARGHSWVSPYWGYCAPKVAFDGESYYTAGLWGDTPESAEGIVYQYADGAWHAGAHLPHMYQPAIVLLDSQKRLIVVYTRQHRPAVFLRAKAAGTAHNFEELPAPSDMPSAYYPGAAIADDVLYMAYITDENYTMYLAQLDLNVMKWSPSVMVAEGQVETKPKTAWTYPILVPAKEGLHVAASNCPDGGEGNTYNQVWHLFYPTGAAQASRREIVAESPVGSNAYAMDMVVDADGGVHIVHMWNHRKYGDPLPESSAPEGTYAAYRDLKTGQWERTRLAPISLAGFHQDAGKIEVLTEENGTFAVARWIPQTRTWEERGNLIEASAVPAGPSFLDVLQRTSGSVAGSEPVLVTDGLLPADEGKPQTRVLWAVLPSVRK